MRTLLCETIAFVFYFMYGSYFEWVFHRYCFHSPKLGYRTFKAHTLVHHQLYKGDDSYTIPEGEHPGHVTMDWWALPAMVIFHLPLFALIQSATGLPTLWGGVLAVSAYYGLYEALHYVMHVPATMKKLNRYTWFRFIDGHHKIHHKHMLSNLNVILPLADLTLGTMRDGNGRRVQILKRVTKPIDSVQTAVLPKSAKPAHVVE